MGLVVEIATPILEGLHEKGPLVTLRNAMSEAQDTTWLDGKTIYRDSWRYNLWEVPGPFGRPWNTGFLPRSWPKSPQ